MADKTISEFSALTTSNESIELIVNDAGETKKISRATLFTGDGSNLTGISGGGSGGGSGEANVQADWNETTTTEDAYILNKPTVQYTAAIPDATASVTGLATATQITKLDGIESSATADQTSAEIKTAYEANADTNGFSDAEQTKLSGIATSANNYSHPSSDGNLHVPATSTTNNGKVLTAGSTAGALTWETAAGGVNITSSATNPTSPSVGDQWFDTSTGILSAYMTDGTDSDWIDISSANGLAASSGGGGAMVFVSKTTISSAVSSVSITGIDTTYDRYVIKIQAKFASSTTFNVRYSQNNGSTFDSASNYDSMGDRNGGYLYYSQHAQGYLHTDSADWFIATLDLEPSVGWINGSTGGIRTGNRTANSHSSVIISHRTLTSFDALQFFAGSGNINSGIITLYGIKDS